LKFWHLKPVEHAAEDGKLAAGGEAVTSGKRWKKKKV
jgi:hypothetical protein